MRAPVILALLACAPAPLELQARPGPEGIEVSASAPLDQVEVRRPDGVVLLRRRLPAPTATVALSAEVPPGRWIVAGRAGDEVVEVPVDVAERAPVRVEVQPAPGGGWVPARGVVDVPVVAGGRAEVLVAAIADAPTTLDVAGGEPLHVDAAGGRAVRVFHVERADVDVQVGAASFTLRPRVLDPAALAAQLTVGPARFPADADGQPDLGRPESRIVVPTRGWEAISRYVGLGGRRRDEWTPWAYLAVPLANRGAAPLDVFVEVDVTRDGAPAAAFRPRLRSGDGDTGRVAVLVRVPPGGEATAALPVFLDSAAVSPGGYLARARVTPLGATTPIHTVETTLWVSLGDTTAQVGFVGALALAVGGAGWAARRLRGWLEGAATSELMTIALFGSALYLVGTASDLLSMAVSAVLGPFSSVVTGLVADVGRTALLGTLVVLLPRPGTLTLAIVSGWLLRALTMGSVGPADVLYTGVSVATHEGFAWLSGLTRGGAWREEGPGRRWARLAAGFGGASVVVTLAGLWLHVILFRLYFADWYVALQVLVPGLLYTTIAARLATEFADGLRKVTP